MDMNAAKNQRESFESVVTSDDSFLTASEGLIATEEMDYVDDHALLECTAPSEGQALPAVNAGQCKVLHFGLEEEGIGKFGIDEEEDYSLLECTAPLQGQALHAVNAGQSNVQRSRCLGKGMSSAVMNEEAQNSPAVSTGPPERPTQTAGRAADSLVRQIGPSVVRRSGPRRVADTPQLQALLEDLADPSATISEGEGDSEEDTAAANVQRSRCLGKGMSSAVMDEEAQNSPAVSTGPPERPTQTAGRAADSLVRRIGPSVVHRSGPRRVADTPQLQALLEDLADPSATISEGEGDSEEDTAAANVQRSRCLGKGINSAVMDEEAQNSPASAQDLQIGPHKLQGALRTHWRDELDRLLCADQVQQGWLTDPSCKHC